MISESGLLKAIIGAGLTFSPEKGDGYVMRNRQASEVVGAIVRYLRGEGTLVENEFSPSRQAIIDEFYTQASRAEAKGFWADARDLRMSAMELRFQPPGSFWALCENAYHENDGCRD